MIDADFIEACLIQFGIKGTYQSLAGEIDFNFLIDSADGSKYILKISPHKYDLHVIEFQDKLLQHISSGISKIKVPNIISAKNGQNLVLLADSTGNIRAVRLLTWSDERIWSSVNQINQELFHSLGVQAGIITNSLLDFHHPFANRTFDWNLDQAEWTENYLHLFEAEEKQLIASFLQKYKSSKTEIALLRKSVIHNDVNDHNIIVSNDKIKPLVHAIIDFGDAVYSTSINDLAVTIAYAVMNKPDPISAACPIVAGYHKSFSLKDAEIKHLYLLVAMRLVLSVTKSAINREGEPENTYLQVSDKPAWELLRLWDKTDDNFAYYTFRKCVGLSPHPDESKFRNWATLQNTSLSVMFPGLLKNNICSLDMTIGSSFLGHRSEFDDNNYLWFKITQWAKLYPEAIPANGYLETRPFYSTEAYKKEGNDGPEYRTVHLGVDYWLEAGTEIHAPLDGVVYSIKNNNNFKDYGPTIILKHEFNGHFFYSLYGHLSVSSLLVVKQGETVKKGDHIGFIGNSKENGSWSPHLHFQIILDMLNNSSVFPGVSFPKEVDVWKSICPDPNTIFGAIDISAKPHDKEPDILILRNRYLGKSLSVSYSNPLHIVRGEGAFLTDKTGRKYLDTVNNVAHVGHEHIRIVNAGIRQMSILNTNTRYLHENIIQFAEKLISICPENLCVVHFVNSGSEANELALRMAYSFTNQKDIIALEMGYHGNTNSCIDISSYKFNGKGGKGKPANTHIIPLPDTFRGKYTGEKAGLFYSDHGKKIIKTLESNGRSPAAFIHESIVSCGGQIDLPPFFLGEVYSAVRGAGGVCIADEVQTGLGRIGSNWWAFEPHGIVPDIMTIGKPLGNGHPVGAVICTLEVANAFANGMEYFNTFGGNPVSCAIGYEVIKVVEDENLMQNALKTGKYLIEGLHSLQNNFPLIGDVRGKGLFLGFELLTDEKIPLPDHTSYLSNRMREMGILTSIDGPDHNVIKIKPPMCFDQRNADEFLRRLSSVLKENAMIM